MFAKSDNNRKDAPKGGGCPGRFGKLWVAVGLSAAFGFLFYLAYYHFWPLVFVAITPLALLAVGGRNPWVFPSVALSAAVTWRTVYYFFETVSPTGLMLVCLYHGLVVAVVVESGKWCRRKTGIGMCFVFPVLWTGGEFLRMSGAVGLPLGLLAPPAAGQLWMIQICDITGLYGLSFAFAMTGGLLADLLRCQTNLLSGLRWTAMGKSENLGLAATVAVWGGIGVYGGIRLAESRNTISVGPAISVVQSDVPTRPGSSNGFDPELLLQEMLAFSGDAVAGDLKPDLVVWPEAPTGMPALNGDWLRFISQAGTEVSRLPGMTNEFSRSERFARSIRSWIERERTPILLGTTGPVPAETVGVELWETYNFATCFEPGGQTPSDEQAKTRLFPVGEYIPWEGSFVHELLEAVILREADMARRGWLSPGKRRRTFKLSADRALNMSEDWHYAVSICNEIMYPDESAVFLSGENGIKSIDFVVNISNDGVFLRNHAMIYHSILLPFRAVEARVGIARSSNTGISGFVKPTGEVYGEVLNANGDRRTGMGAPEMDLIEEVVRLRIERGAELVTNPELRGEFNSKVSEIKRLRAAAGVSGVQTQIVWIDSRKTFYSRYGDLLGPACMIALLVVLVCGLGSCCRELLCKRFERRCTL